MNTSMLIEAIGYLGSALVLVSFLMVSVVKLRIVSHRDRVSDLPDGTN